ncbi:MAG: hypothetical protein RIR12_1580 [Bacteroidota bacterium]|jgi:hypothetical protein
MKTIFLSLFALVIMLNTAHSQKSVLYSENIYLEVTLLEKDDSVGAEVRITNLSKEKVYFPTIEAFKIPQYELSCIAGVLDIRIGISSRFSGIPLEFTHVLQQLCPKESLLFKTTCVKRELIVKSVIAFDFITIKDLQTILSPKELRASPTIKGEDYASLIHIARAESR